MKRDSWKVMFILKGRGWWRNELGVLIFEKVEEGYFVWVGVWVGYEYVRYVISRI